MSAFTPESNNVISNLRIASWPPVFCHAFEAPCFAALVACLTALATPLPKLLAEIPPLISAATPDMNPINLFISDAITQINKIVNIDGIPSGLPILPTSICELLTGGSDAIVQKERRVILVIILIVQTSSQHIL